MIVKYGTFKFRAGQNAVTISRRTLETAARTPYGYTEHWDIAGKITNQGGSVATMDAKIAQVEAVFNKASSHGKDLILLFPDGSTASQHALRNSKTLGGTRIVTPVSYPEGRGPQYITERDFTVSIEADILYANPDSILTAFEETIEFSRGRMFGHLEPLRGDPVKQRLKEKTIFRAVQSGRAVGVRFRPQIAFIAPPIWPGALIGEPTITAVNAERRGNELFNFGVSWRYDYESAFRLNGVPHEWRV